MRAKAVQKTQVNLLFRYLFQDLILSAPHCYLAVQINSDNVRQGRGHDISKRLVLRRLALSPMNSDDIKIRTYLNAVIRMYSFNIKYEC